MEIKVQSIHFDATEKLQAFIEKKVGKIEKQVGEGAKAEVILKVVKPETAMNKEAQIHVTALGGSLDAKKIADTFEEAIDDCVDAIKRQIEKHKEAH